MFVLPGNVVGRAGLEPATYGLKGPASWAGALLFLRLLVDGNALRELLVNRAADTMRDVHARDTSPDLSVWFEGEAS